MRSILDRKKILLGGCVLLCLAFVACSSFVSKTFSIVIYIEDRILSTDEEINQEACDITDDEDWDEHHDKIKRIDSVEFALEITNYEDTEATGQVYISEDSTLATPGAIQENALLVLDGIVIPPQTTKVVERKESIKYTRNYEQMRDYVINGYFHVYAIAKNVPFHVEVQESLAVIVSFTAEN